MHQYYASSHNYFDDSDFKKTVAQSSTVWSFEYKFTIIVHQSIRFKQIESRKEGEITKNDDQTKLT